MISLVALGWAVAAYTNALRQAHIDDYRTHWPGLLLQTLWHIGVVSARVLAIVYFASEYKAWVFIFIGTFSLNTLLVCHAYYITKPLLCLNLYSGFCHLVEGCEFYVLMCLGDLFTWNKTNNVVKHYLEYSFSI